MSVYTQESREVLRVRPSEAAADDPDLEDRIDQIASLHDLHQSTDSGIVGNLLGDSGASPVTFELLALSSGTDSPVELFYSCDDALGTLEKRLDAIYPASFDIERDTLDLGAKLITPVAYTPSEFLDALKAGDLVYDLDDLVEDVSEGGHTAFGGELESGLDSESEPGLVPLDEYHNVSRPSPNESSAPDVPANVDGDSSLTPTEALDATTPHDSSTGQESEFETPVWVRTDDVPSDHRFLRLPDRDGAAVKVNPSSTLEEIDSLMELSRPTFTDDRQVLARPSRDAVEPSAVRWRGKGDRKQDWMTTLRSDDTAEATSRKEYRPKPSVVAELLRQLAEIEHPVVFQLVFRRKPTWKANATARKRDLKRGEDTAVQSALSTLIGDAGESESMSTPVEKRINLIEAKNAKRTFNVNIRAVAVDATAATNATDAGSRDSMDEITAQLRELCPAFDPMDGQYYEIDGSLVEPDGGKISTGTSSTPQDELEYLLDRELTTSDDEESLTERVVGSSRTRSEIVMNPQELADLIMIPPGEAMPKEAFRGTRVKHEEENPLPRPNEAILRKFSEGMAVGYPLDENRNAMDDPVRLPREVLNTHYARFATTGFGKSVAANNDILTLHEATDGPEILIDPKGDGMCDRYLQAHFAKFDTLEDVYYFDVPGDLPAVAFFDIRPLLAQGRSREDAIQDKVDHFHEIMRMVMGPSYDNAYVAIMVLSFLIKAKFDPEYGVDAFSLDDLFTTARRMQEEERAPRVSEDRTEVEESLDRHFENDDASFKETMTAVLNRLDKLREDVHLYRMFNHIPAWDADAQTYADSTSSLSFSEFFADDVVFLFDLGDLRPNAARAMALVLLSGLWDDLQERDADQYHPLVNLILEEAAPFAATDLMTEQLLAQARSFELSIGLIMQYPGQVRAENERTFAEIRNNVHSTFYGKLESDAEISDSLATQELDPVTMKTKLTSMRPGEWLADLPSPKFNTPEPSPFSMQALPVPTGHPESDQPLDRNERRKFREAKLPRARKRVKHNHSLQRRVHDSERTIEGSADGGDGAEATEGDSASSSSMVTPSSTQSDDADGPSHGRTTGSSLFASGPDDSFEVDSPGEASGDDIFVSENPLTDDTDVHGPSGADRTESEAGSDIDSPAVSTASTDGDTAGERTDSDHTSTTGTSSLDEVIDVPPGGHSRSEETRDEAGSTPPMDPPDALVEQSHADLEEAHRQPDKQSSGGSDSLGDLLSEDAPAETDSWGGEDPSSDVSAGSPDSKGSGGWEGGLESSDDVLEQARTINATLTGSEKFEALMELSRAADAAGIDVDDDALISPPDGPSDSASNDHRESNSEEHSIDHQAPRSDTDPSAPNDEPNTDESGTLETHWPAGSDLPPEQSDADPDDTASSSDQNTVDDPTPGAQRGLSDFNKRQDFAERVKQNLNETPDFTETPNAPDSAHDLSEADETFLNLVLDAVNDELADYSLLDLESMNPLVERANDPNLDHLREIGFIESHRVIRKQYFSILPPGREYLRRSLSSRDGIGDLGEKTPHKVGVCILWHYLSRRDDTARVDRYQTINDHKYDVVAYNDTNDVVAVGEAETPSNNADAIITDYEKLAAIDADAIWLCKNRDTAIDVIDALEQSSHINPEFNAEDKISFSALMDAVAERSLPGLTEIQGFTSLYDDLNS